MLSCNSVLMSKKALFQFIVGQMLIDLEMFVDGVKSSLKDGHPYYPTAMVLNPFKRQWMETFLTFDSNLSLLITFCYIMFGRENFCVRKFVTFGHVGENLRSEENNRTGRYEGGLIYS